MNYTVQKTTADVYKIRIKDRFSWATITIRQWVEGGSIDVQSDFGSYSYSWTSIGPRDFRAFLMGLDYGYFMEKAARGSRGYRFSPERTIEGMKQFVIERRRGGDIDSATARAGWEAIEDLDVDIVMETESWFVASVLDRSDLFELFGGDYDSIPLRSERCPQCAGFWNEIWPIACETWREELALNGAA